MKSKIVAPIIITAIIVLYYLLFALIIAPMMPNIWLKLLFIVIPAGLAGTMIYVFIQRIKEIRSGEEDDLSKY